MKKRLLSLICVVLLLLSSTVVYASSQTGGSSPAIQSETAVLIDGDTGQVLFDKNMHRQMNPASITKIMTALLALEDGELSQKVTISSNAITSLPSGASNIALQEGEELSLEHLLYAMAIKSANEAANGIAEAIGGTMSGFADKMTARAIELGAVNTTFKNANGLTVDGHLTTAYDMALITMEAIKHPAFLQIFNTRTYSIPSTNKQQDARTLTSSNGLMSGEYQYDYLIASKTGITTAAGNTMVAVAKKDGRTLIAVVLRTVGDPTLKYQDINALFGYGFDSFSPVTYTAAELSRTGYPVTDSSGKQREVSLEASDVTVLLLNSLAVGDISIEYDVSSDLHTANVIFTLKDIFQDKMVLPLATAPLTVISDDSDADDEASLPAANTAEPEEKASGKSFGKVFLSVFLVLFLICALAATGLLVLRQYNIRKRRDRKRRQQNRNRQQNRR